MKKIYFIALLIAFGNSVAQVGINTTTPTKTLEVVGDVKVDSTLYLENPGISNTIRGSKFLIRTATNEVVRYDINISKYGPINYAEFKFESLSPFGLLDFDTKISTDDYLVSVQGYSCGIAGAGRTGSIMPHSLNNNINIEGYQIYAYPNATTNTWFLRAFVNDSEWQRSTGSGYVNTSIDMWLNIMIYRKGFITKSLSDISVDMGNMETGTAPLPAGF